MSTTDDYRYPGSRPFQDTELDQRLFFGREEEKQALLHLILAENLVVLFAKSGIGKTSLINAGLLQLLRERNFIPLKIRFNNSESAPLQTIYATIKDSVKGHTVEFKPGAKNSLWEYFKTVEFWSAEDVLLNPILILDQFEELFTLHSLARRQSFISQLAGLIRGRIPKEIQASSTSEQEFPDSEIPSHVKIIIAMREDFLGQLEELAAEIPDIFYNRFRLLPLQRTQAQQAIEKPASLEDEQIRAQSFHYEPATVEMMLNFLCKQRRREQMSFVDEVEPFQLQLLCRHVENIVRKKLVQGFKNVVVYKNNIGGAAGMQQVLRNFYNDQIKRLGSFLNRGRARKLCETGLISVNDRRLSLEEEEISRRFKMSGQLLNRLVNSRLLRAESRVGSVYYELSHDTLVEPIRESQRRRRFSRIKYGALIFLVSLLLVIILGQSWLIKSRAYHFYYAKGYALSQQGKYSEAIESFKDAIELYPLYAEAYNEMGDAFFEQGNYDEAIKQYQKTIRIEPDFVVAYQNLGNVFFEQGSYDEAIRQYQQVIALSPGFTDAYENLGNTLKTLGKDSEAAEQYQIAIKNYQRLLQIYPDDVEVHNDLGRVFLHQGKYDKAIEMYRKALLLETGRNFPRAYNNLGIAFRKHGNYKKAIENFKNALLFNPEYIEAYKNLGQALVHQGYYTEAIEKYQQALQLEPQDVELYHGLGIAYQHNRNVREAIKYFQTAIVHDPNNTAGYNHLGTALLTQGKYEEAINNFQQALQLDPKLSGSYYNWGDTLILQGKYEEAIERYRQALRLEPMNAYGHRKLGNLLMRQGKHSEALTAYQHALQLDPADAYSYYELGNLFARLENYNDALRNYQTAIHLDPENMIAKMNFAEFCLRAGYVDKALQLAREMLEEPNMSHEGILAMQLISISSLFFQDNRFTALLQLGELIKYYRSLSGDYAKNLKYAESKHFIRATEKLPETDKILLLALIDLLEAPAPQAEKILKKLETLLADAFEDSIVRIIFPQTRQL